MGYIDSVTVKRESLELSVAQELDISRDIEILKNAPPMKDRFKGKNSLGENNRGEINARAIEIKPFPFPASFKRVVYIVTDSIVDLQKNPDTILVDRMGYLKNWGEPVVPTDEGVEFQGLSYLIQEARK